MTLQARHGRKSKLEKTMKNEKKLILASKSPRRIELLRNNGYDPIIVPADIEETIPSNASMEEVVISISRDKAECVKESIDYPALIIAADTIVYKDGEIMGKPKDKEDGFRMLAKLRNTFHYVATGVTFIDTETNEVTSFCDVTKVYFKDYSDEELDKYLDTPEAYDKAGGYGIQSGFAKYVDHIEGNYENVMGLPWYRVEKYLKEEI